MMRSFLRRAGAVVVAVACAGAVWGQTVISISAPALPGGEVSVPYPGGQFTASDDDGTATCCTWSASGLSNGLSLDSSGVLSGTPNAAGTINFTVTATDSNTASATTGTLSITIVAAPSISPASLPAGEEGVSYAPALTASGGTPGYTWSQTGALPSGVSFANGSFSGTPGPGTAGNYSITVQVTDSAGGTGSQGYNIVIVPPPSITTASLPSGEATVPYSAPLTATGGTLPYSWVITSGALPAGMTFSGGALGGTPSAADNATLTFQVTDSAFRTASATLVLNIVAAPSITTTSIPQGEVGAVYPTTNLATAGGTVPFSWSITSGTLPAGLSFSGGTFSGTPAAATSGNITVQLSDAKGAVTSQVLALTVVGGPVISPAGGALTSGEAGASYSQPLNASGGSGGNSWSVASGALPDGLTLGGGGTISGTPTASGPFNFSIKVTDSAGGSDTQAFSINIVPGPSISTAPILPSGTVEVSYASVTLDATGGTGPYSWSITAGSLPNGLTLGGSTGIISGTPTSGGTANFTVQVSDAKSVTATKVFTITIASGLTISTPPSLPGGAAGAAYSQALSAVGGTAPYTWSITAGSLPSGLGLNPATGVINGTPTSSGTFNFIVQVTDNASVKATKTFTLTISASLAIISPPTLPSGAVGTTYSQSLAASGGASPYSWNVLSGSLPAGLMLNGTGALTGTPTAGGMFSFTAQVSDSGSLTASKTFSLTIAASLAITTQPDLPSGGVGTLYGQPLTAVGGSGVYTWSVILGSLPGGLSLGPSTGNIGGTPTSVGSFAFTVQVMDSNSLIATKALTLSIVSALTITTAPVLPGGAVGTAYSRSLTAVGGNAPYVWAINTGALPPGTSLTPSTGLISGTPTATGDFNFTAQVADSNSVSTTKAFTITVVAGLTITTAPVLPNGSVGVTYTQTLAVAGGKAPYSWSVTTGGLPGGLTLDAAGGAIFGIPTGSGTFNFTVKVTDAATGNATKAFTITTAAGLTIATAPTLPAGAVSAAYTQALNAVGGTSPYHWSIIQGALPAGMTFNATTGGIAGTPTESGAFNFTVQVTDSSSVTASKPFTLEIASSLAITTPPVLPSGSVSVQYVVTLAAAGGSAPYRWLITNGALPLGIALSPSTGALSGTPVSTGSFGFTVQVSDSSSLVASQAFTLTVASGLVIATPPQLPGGSVGVSYSQTLNAVGGANPYQWFITNGTVPPGLALNPASGVLSGIPQNSGSFTFTVQVRGNASATASQVFGLTIGSGLAITSGTTLPGAALNQAYSFTLDAAGGRPPYTWTLIGGVLPAGLALASSGTVTGTPTSAGTSHFTVRVSDATSASITQQLTLVVAATLTITTPQTLPGGTVGFPFTVTFAASGGQAPYHWSVSGGTLPAGVTLDQPTGVLAGTPTRGGSFNVNVQVVDTAGLTASQTFAISIGVPPPPKTTVTGVPDSSTPAQQITFGVNLASGYAYEITGTATISFEPDAVTPADDQTIQFSTGGRTASFKILKNATQSSQIALQTGSVSGTITLSFALQAAGVDLDATGLDQTIKIARAAPAIQSVNVTRNSSGFTIQVQGLSTPRELTEVDLHFTAAAGANLQTTDLTEVLTDVAKKWYQSQTSAQFGSQFILVLPIAASQGSATAVSGVSVVLKNSAGDSPKVSATF